MSIEERLYGADLFGNPMNPAPVGPVAERFGFPPFSVLDARQGEWQERKRAWSSVGIQGEIGRSDSLTYSAAAKSFDYYRVKEGTRETSDEQGTSMFDPTLCECIYRWFSAPCAQVIDPFAGGSVRGIVAGMLNRKYWGCDLRQEQIEANQQQAQDIQPSIFPQWVCGDAMDVLEDAPAADLVFSCPPYGDLERYSDDPRDLSAMEWHTFAAAYRRIILRSIQRLRDNRFACFVVGDFRDNRGYYRNFVSETIHAFEACGARLYNEAVLVTSVGSASMRVTKQFESGRKFAKTHQNVLIFCKGEWRKASAACSEPGAVSETESEVNA